VNLVRARLRPPGSDAPARSPADPVPATRQVFDRRERIVAAPPEAVFRTVSRIGGTAGWPNAVILWTIRGAMDRAVGGPGMRRGRRHPEELEPGDVLDGWRVEACRPPELLRLVGEMRFPGRAWLQFEVLPEDGGRSRLVQTGLFEPRGLPGHVYWWAMLPFHQFVFGGMIRELARRAVASAPTVAGSDRASA